MLLIFFYFFKCYIFQAAEEAQNPYFEGPHNRVAAKKGYYKPRHQ